MDEMSREFEQLIHSWEQRRVRQRPLHAAGRLVQRLVAKYGLASRMSQRELDRAWQLAVNDRWPAKTQLAGLRNGTLEVIVVNSMVLQEMVLARDELLASMQQSMPQSKIKRLAFRIGAVR